MYIKNCTSAIIKEITASSEKDLEGWASSCQGENHTRQRAARDISNAMTLLRNSKNINNITLDLSFLNLSTLPPKS